MSLLYKVICEIYIYYRVETTENTENKMSKKAAYKKKEITNDEADVKGTNRKE